MRSLYTVAALLAVASAQSSYDSLFRTPPRNSQYSRLPSQYPARPTTPRSTPSSYVPTQSHTHLHPSYPYPAPVPKVPEKPLHEHDSSMLHENPWDQCKRDIATSQMNFETVSEDCNESVDGLSGLQAQLAGLEETLEAQDTDIIRTGVFQNLFFNTEQTGDLGSLKDNVTEILDDLKDAKFSLSSLQLLVDMLPDFDAIEALITGLETKQGTVAMLNDDQAFVIMDSDQTTLTTEIPSLDQAIKDVNTRITTLVTESTAVMTADEGIVNDLDTLVDLFAMQEIVDNFFSVNAVDVTPGATEMFNVEDSMGEGTFTVCDKDLVLEVFVHADFKPFPDSPMAGMNEEVQEIQLLDGSAVVASATYTADMVDIQARNFNLYYKGVVPADDTTYTIRLISPANQVVGATALALNFMWGYRTFNESYPLGNLNTETFMAC